MTVSEAMGQIEANLNDLGARPFNPGPVSADFDLADLNDQLAKIQELRSCVNGICQLGDWRPAKHKLALDTGANLINTIK